MKRYYIKRFPTEYYSCDNSEWVKDKKNATGFFHRRDAYNYMINNMLDGDMVWEIAY